VQWGRVGIGECKISGVECARLFLLKLLDFYEFFTTEVDLAVQGNLI